MSGDHRGALYYVERINFDKLTGNVSYCRPCAHKHGSEAPAVVCAKKLAGRGETVVMYGPDGQATMQFHPRKRVNIEPDRASDKPVVQVVLKGDPDWVERIVEVRGE